ncbi:phosphatase PAP2 family protein [Thermoleophilia bacterium SCSIO 60948]|nr:phosphatase PAP2 family protein [Thermoleophilia bacterium SCSIO 60948]
MSAGAASTQSRASARPEPWLLWSGAFVVFSILALSGIVPAGPIGDWRTPLWADVILAPFSGAAMLAIAAVVVAAGLRDHLDPRIARPALRLVAALVVATAIEVVIKAAFPGTAGPLGPVTVGPIDFGFYPSGHTLRATVVAIALASAGPIRGPLRWSFLVLPAAVGTMLVSAGGHFPVDVAGGALLGAAAASWALAPRERLD